MLLQMRGDSATAIADKLMVSHKAANELLLLPASKQPLRRHQALSSHIQSEKDGGHTVESGEWTGTLTGRELAQSPGHALCSNCCCQLTVLRMQ